MDDPIKDLEAIPDFEGLDFPTVEELEALELEMLPELERIELELLPELERMEVEMLPELERWEREALDYMDTLPDALPVMDHPLQAKRRATAAARDPGEDQNGGRHNAKM